MSGPGLNVPFVDFRAHVAAHRTEIDEAIARVLDSGWFILGPEGEGFEKELALACGARDAVAVANGTEALQLGLLALGVGAGDEVVTSPLSAAPYARSLGMSSWLNTEAPRTMMARLPLFTVTYVHVEMLAAVPLRFTDCHALLPAAP